MTRLDDERPPTDGSDAVREALHAATEHLRQVPDLVERVHDRAGRIRRRRRQAGVVGLAGAAVAALVVGVAITLPGRGASPGPTFTGVPPAGSGGPSGQPSTATGRPFLSPPASSAPSSPGPTSPRPTGGGTPSQGPSSTVPAGPWGAAQLDDPFGSTVLDPTRWIRYQGAAASQETLWAADQVSVGGGTLRLGVARVSDSTPVARAGGVKVAGPGQRYGRWELRWRMTAAPGVVGQFLFLGEGPGGIGHVATLSSADRTLTLADLVHGTRRELTVDGRRFHTLAVELTPDRVRWFLDGTVVSDRAGGAPTRPVIAALQALVPGPDCGARPLPSGCSGPATFPQTLEVDQIRFWPYRG
jgi:hypothetical protein